jgi:hypothetical protein
VRTLALCAGLLLASTVANAAQFKIEQSQYPSRACPYFYDVYIDGTIEPGDDKKFLYVTRNIRISCATVELNSNGGDLVAGLNIGLRIKQYEFGTVVSSINIRTDKIIKPVCASVCGMIWLAGYPSMAARGSFIGFHAAYFTETGQPTPGGNAMVGAYLRDLGLGFDAINYLTQTSPNQMEWLTEEKAIKYNIKMEIIGTPLRYHY